MTMTGAKLGKHYGIQTAGSVANKVDAQLMLDNLDIICTMSRAGTAQHQSPAAMVGFEAAFTSAARYILVKYLAS